MLAIDYMSANKGKNGGIVLNALCPIIKKEYQECPFFVGAEHFLMSFAKSLTMNCYEETRVKIVTLCAVPDKVPECHT